MPELAYYIWVLLLTAAYFLAILCLTAVVCYNIIYFAFCFSTMATRENN